MKKTFLKFLILTAIIFLPLFAHGIFACQCRGLETPYEAFNNANAVFVGKVVSVKDESGVEIVKKKVSDTAEDYSREREEGKRYYRFAVQEWFKGNKESELTISHSLNMCEFGFDVGDEFLIYAHENKGKLYVNTFCLRSTDAARAQKEDLHFLHDLVKGVVEPKIYGSVRLSEKDLSTNSYRSKFLEGIKIVAQSNKKRYVTVTDKNGLYRFNKLPDGKYTVNVDSSGKYKYNEDYSWDRLKEINLQSNNYKNQVEYYMNQFEYNKFIGTNAYTNFQLSWNNRITGKVLDSEGKFLENGTVRFIPLNQITQINNKPLLRYSTNKYLNDYLFKENEKSIDRKYIETGATPGKYIIAVEIFAPFSSGKEKLRMYYPQADSPQMAKIIEIGEFDNRTIDIKLPDEYITREIEVTLFGEDENPIKDGSVSIQKKENSQDADNIIYDSEFIKDGRFRLQVFENAEYWIHADVNRVEAKPVRLIVGKTNQQIKIIIPNGKAK